MDKLRRTLSFRSRKRGKKETPQESNKPHQWTEDERKVREGTCSFQVKYLGCLEVSESRGMEVCEEAIRRLKASAKKQQRAILYVSGDAIRVVDEITKKRVKHRHTKPTKWQFWRANNPHGDMPLSTDTPQEKGLIVDQTIEKVSFCAPDRNHEKGFAYICRDGTTRRWMCHGFLAVKESGERLSHAVGCAFAVCLEKKQSRERETVETVYNETGTTFTRIGSFRQTTITEKLYDPQSAKIAEPVAPQAAAVNNSHAVERPRASNEAFIRQGSFRTFQKLQDNSPFKRSTSLRLNELPSYLNSSNSNGANLHSNSAFLAGTKVVHTIPEEGENDPVSALCQQLTSGLAHQQQQPAPPPRTFNNNGIKTSQSYDTALSSQQPPSQPPPPLNWQVTFDAEASGEGWRTQQYANASSWNPTNPFQVEVHQESSRVI